MAPGGSRRQRASRTNEGTNAGTTEPGNEGPLPLPLPHDPSATAESSTSYTIHVPARHSHDNDDDSASNASTPSTTSAPITPSFPHPTRISTFSKSYTSTEETQLLRKLDRNLTLFLSLLYLLSFLDRSNIGNARIAGLSENLNLTSTQYSWLLTAFYITYILFEPLILCYRFLPARWYIPACVVSWGIVASCQSLVTGFGSLVVLRGCLGITEAAFGPGVPFYMTFFYRRRELAYRVGLQISAAPLATSFASLLAWAIVWLNEKVGGGWVDSWRVLFLVEGFPSVVVGVWALWSVPNGPGSARWLSPRERKVAVLRLQEESGRHGMMVDGQRTGLGSNADTVHSRWMAFAKDLRTTLTDPKCYLTAFMFFSVNVSFASLPVFLPTIINDMNFSALTSQALAAPPYLCAFVFVLFIGRRSDTIPDSRSMFLMSTASMSAISYAAIAIAGAVLQEGSGWSITVRYAFIYPAAMGLFASVVLIITWTLNNQASETGKGLAMTVLNLFGQCGPLVGVRLFPDSDAPGFVAGMGTCAAFMAGVVVLAGGMRWWLVRLNQKVLFEGGAAAVASRGEEVEMQERLMGREREDRGRGGGGGGGGGGEGEAEFREVGLYLPEVQRFRFML